MSGDPELNAMARRVIDANHYMVLGTWDPDGRPRLSPVYYTPARYTDFYWISSPDAHHSLNVAERPGVQIVIFDSSAPVGEGEAVYLAATARRVPDDELEALCPEATRTKAGARRFDPDELQGDSPLRLYVASVTSCEVHVAGRDRTDGGRVDVRRPADPNSA
jgi:hypothetical protein